MGTDHLELEYKRFRSEWGKRKRQLNIVPKEKYREALSSFDCHGSAPRRESTGDNMSKICFRRAVVAAGPTCRSQSTGPKRPVVRG